MHQPYRQFVEDIARVTREARRGPGKLIPPPHPEPPKNAPLALLFAPHPDDECIMGGLALRLARECQWRVIDIAVTLGAKKERRAERHKELKAACQYLGFGLQLAAPGGLEKISATNRADDPEHWNHSVAAIAKILRQHQPRAVFFPHEFDWHGTHMGVHWLVMHALRTVAGLDCYLVEMEYWGQMTAPNLLVEYGVSEVADLVAATSLHTGEVKRNPYHLRLPAWMQDNVRRGAELVGGAGRAAPAFMFGQLFRLRRWRHEKIENCLDTGRFLATTTSPDVLFSH